MNASADAVLLIDFEHDDCLALFEVPSLNIVQARFQLFVVFQVESTSSECTREIRKVKSGVLQKPIAPFINHKAP